MDIPKFDKMKYDNAYKKANYERITFSYRPDEFNKELLKQIEKFEGESVNEFIEKADTARIDRIEKGLE